MKWLGRMLGFGRDPKPRVAAAAEAEASKPVKEELRSEIARFGRVVEDYRKMDVVLVKRR